MLNYNSSTKDRITIIDHMDLIKPYISCNTKKKKEIDNISNFLNELRMKIISVKKYRAICDCGSEFEFDSSDIKSYEYDSEYFGIYTFKCVYCPSCKKRISESKFK